MPLAKQKTKCPQCQAVLSVKQELHGRNVKCPGCGARFVLELSVVDSNPSIFRGNSDQFETTENQVETNQAETLVSNRKTKDQQGVQVGDAYAEPSQVEKQMGVRDFGRYRLIKKLGRGGFGEVWEAEDVHLQRRVALKLPTFPPSDAKKAKRFITEAQSAAQLGHPNIVAVFDAGTVESQHYLAIEYIAGQPLDKFAKEQNIDNRNAARMVAALARALSYAHGEGIVHRDIKPANIVLEADGTPKIVDFGLAKRLGVESNQTVDGTVLGTPAYMSPEQARGATNEIGPHSDQYSLGVVLYWLLTGQAPFIGPTIAVISQVINSDPMPPRKVAASINPKLEAICLKSMAKVPASRYRNCLEFARDLDRYLNGEDVIAKPEGLPARVLRLARRYPRQFALGIGFAILSSIALVTTVSGMARAYSLAAIASKAEKESEDRLSEQSELRKKSEAQLVLADAARTRSVEALRTTEEKKKEIEQVNQDLEASIAANVSKNAELKAKMAAIDQSKSVTTKSEEVTREAFAKSNQITAEVTASKETTEVKLVESARLLNSWNLVFAAQKLDSILEKDRDWRWYLLSKLARSKNQLVASKSMLLELKPNQSASVTYDMDDHAILLRIDRELSVLDDKSFEVLERNMTPAVEFNRQSQRKLPPQREYVRSSKSSVWFNEVNSPDFTLEHLIEDPRDHKVFAWIHNSDRRLGSKDLGTLLSYEDNVWKKVWTTQNLAYVKAGELKFDPNDRNILFATDSIVVTREAVTKAIPNTQRSGGADYVVNGRLIQPDDIALKERLITPDLRKVRTPINAWPNWKDRKVIFGWVEGSKGVSQFKIEFELELDGLAKDRLQYKSLSVFLGSDFSLIVLYGNVLARYELK